MKKPLLILIALLFTLLPLAACQWQQPAPEPLPAETPPPAPEPLPAEGSLAVTTVERSHAFADEENAIYGQVTLKGLLFSGNSAAVAIQADLDKAEEAFLAELADEEGALFANDSSLSFDHEISYSLAYLDETLVSVIRDSVILEAKAAHGSIRRQAYVYDAADGRRLELADLLGENWRETAVSAIYQQINEAGELNNYYPNLERLLISEFRPDQWYADEENVFIVYNPYQIAPYAAGVLEFALPRQAASLSE